MECRLGQAPLPSVKLTFARQQPFAQQTLGALQRQTFMKVLVISHQDVFDMVRMIYEKCFLRAEPKIGNVAILRGEVLEERQRAAAVGEQTRQRKRAARAWRIALTHALLAPFNGGVLVI
jgi:hypothetical protein